jgi:hypothetical protein
MPVTMAWTELSQRPDPARRRLDQSVRMAQIRGTSHDVKRQCQQAIRLNQRSRSQAAVDGWDEPLGLQHDLWI